MDKTLISIYLFSDTSPRGEMFKFAGGEDSEEYKQMLNDGWVETPAKLNLPQEMKTGVTIEQATDAHPEDLRKLLESYGFIVLTPEQLKAEAVKMADFALDIGNFSDSDLIAEAERRGLKDPGVNVDSLLEEFQECPTDLTKEELIELARAKFDIKLRGNMSEANMIAKITEALNEAE